MDLFDLVAKILLDTSEYEQGLDDSEKKADSFGSKLGSAVKKGSALAVAGVTAVATGATVMAKKFTDGINATAEYGDNVDKMSQKIGISAESYQKWDYVMQRAGTSVDNLKMGMKTLSTQAEANSDSFQKLGISQEEVANLSQEELFERTVKGLSDMEAGTERTALATELLGRAGADLGPLLNEGSDAIEEQMEIAEKYGMVMSDEAVKASADFEDSLTTMNMTMTGLKNRMMGQFLPAVTDVTDGLGKIFAGDMSGADDIVKGFDGIIDKITETMPKIMETGGKIIEGISTSIIENLPSLFNTATDVVLSFVEYVIQALPSLADSATQIVTTLVEGIGQSLPTLIPTAIDAILTIVQGLLDNIPMLVEASVTLIVGLAEGLINALPILLEMAPTIIESLVSALIGASEMLISAALQVILVLVDGLLNNLPQIVEAAIKIIASLVSGIVKAFPQIVKAGGSLVRTFSETIKNIKWGELGKNIISGIAKGITGGLKIIKDAAKRAAEAALNTVKSLLGIASPSKVFRDQIGKNMALGLAEGFEDYMPYDEIEDALSFDYNVPELESVMSVGTVGTDDEARAVGVGDNITINVYATERQDARQIAEEVQRQFVLWERQRKAVYA